MFIGTRIIGGGDFAVFILVVAYGWIGFTIGAVVGIVFALLVQRYLCRNDLGPTARRKKTLLITSLVAGIPLLVTGMLWTALNSNTDSGPPDKELLANFQQHEATFDQLAQMVQADKGLERVDDDWTRPNDPKTVSVSPARIAQYRRLLDASGIPRGFQSGGAANGVEFYYWLNGDATSSDTEKGYAYLKNPPANLLDNLDKCQTYAEFDGKSYYRHIQGNWYLFWKFLPG